MKNLKEEVAKTRKVALYASFDSEFYMVDEVRYVTYDENGRQLPDGEKRERPMKGYVRITEPASIKFSAIEGDEIIGKAVESLNETEREILLEMEQKLARIREQRGQLLALTHQANNETPKDVA